MKEENQKDLTACFDWVQVTIKHLEPIQVIQEILELPIEILNRNCIGGVKGLRGYTTYAEFGHMKILLPHENRQDEGLQLYMTGKGCRDFERILIMQNRTWSDFFKKLSNYPINYPRIDIAIDDRKTYFSIEEIIE